MMSGFDESQHPRGNPTNAGQFAAKSNSAPASGLPAIKHEAIVPMGAGEPPFCTCGVIGGRGIDIDGTPLLADHLRAVQRS